MYSEKESLEQWRKRLNASGLPVFSRTVRDMRQVSASKATSAQDLSNVIGHDASMAARVIQIANSPMFNPQNRDIDTISAAVVLVGFDAVRELVISVSVIEEMLKGHQHCRVGQHMARAFHAAAQARSFAKQTGDNGEEVFVAALLKHVGDMAFWSRAEHEAVALEAAMGQGCGNVDAERRVLGFELAQLSKVLAEDWNLGELVCHVLDGRHGDDRRVKHVALAHQLAEVLDLFGWGSDQAGAMLVKLADHLDMKVSDVARMVDANLEEAAAIAARFGVKKIADALPRTPHTPRTLQTLKTGTPPVEPARSDSVMHLLSGVLSDLAAALEQGASRHALMQRVVSGLCAALGLQSAYFALLSADRSKLKIKYAACSTGDSELLGLAEPVRDNTLFARALDDTKMILFQGGVDSDLDSAWQSGGDGAIVAIRLGGQPVGLLYGEVPGQQSVSDTQAAGFRQLGQQIALIMTQAAQ